MKKIFLSLIILGAFVFNCEQARASKLPEQVWEYVKKEIPGAVQRFDSVIVVSGDVMYVPLYPAQKETVETLSLEYSYPEAKALRQLPEVAIFNNNFVLLKIFKNKKDEFTITSYEDLPIKVKLGVMPQDMLVPVGLKVPENLMVVLGDLNIPSKSDGALAINKDGTESQTFSLELSKNTTFQPLKELVDKRVYVTSNASKFMMVYDSTSKNPLYELKLNALPSKIVASNSTKFALVLYFADKNLEVIDLKNERVLVQIPIENTPKDAELDQFKNVAYVSSPGANAIYAVDLNSANLAKTIKLAQAPGILSVSDDGGYLAFVDNNTQDLCYMELSGDYTVRVLAPSSNISKIIFNQDKIFAISRVKNKIDVYNIVTGEFLGTKKISQKPTDALYYKGKIYILCAGGNALDVYDISADKITQSVKIPNDGFYSKITRVPNQPNALLTGIGTGKYQLFDLENMKILRSQPLDVKVSNILVVDK